MIHKSRHDDEKDLLFLQDDDTNVTNPREKIEIRDFVGRTTDIVYPGLFHDGDRKRKEKRDDTRALYMLLGSISVDILESLQHGVVDVGTIEIFTGYPADCITGRLPVLDEMKLVDHSGDFYRLTKEGQAFLNELRREY